MDEEARFWLFYRKSSEALFRKAYRMCNGQQADADDAHQRAYLKALEHWATIGSLTDEQRAAWLATTLVREVLQMWRAPHRSREAGSRGSVPEHAVLALDDADAVVAADLYRRACQAIARLEGRQREVIALHCLAGYEMTEVAGMLGIKLPTVRAHLHSGRARLREIMTGEEGSA
jgi:RNA polymerase sigma-70 factor (ECF subfamily)